ncbi:hypothetical protein V8E54_002478 [Elaphomyces granulatus]
MGRECPILRAAPTGVAAHGSFPVARGGVSEDRLSNEGLAAVQATFRGAKETSYSVDSILDAVRRQEGTDPAALRFMEVLDHLHDDAVTIEDWKVLASRVQTQVPEDVPRFKDALRIYATREKTLDGVLFEEPFDFDRFRRLASDFARMRLADMERRRSQHYQREPSPDPMAFDLPLRLSSPVRPSSDSEDSDWSSSS